MKTAVIRSSWMEGYGYRLDCSPYLGGALETKILLEKLPLRKDKLHTLTAGFEGGIYNGPHFSRTFVESAEHGVPFVGSSSMLHADLSDLPLLSKKQAMSPKLAHLELQPGMSLISCSGTIGKMVYGRRDMVGRWSSQHIMKVVADPAKIPSGYLYAYLSSKFGIPLVTSGTYGAIIQSINPEHIWDLPVPRLGDALEHEVHGLVEEAAELRSRASAKLDEAAATFDALISSLPLRKGKAWTSAVPSPRVAHRMDVGYFDPNAWLIRETLSEGKHQTIAQFCDSISLPGIFKRIHTDDPNQGARYFTGASLFCLEPEPKSYLSPLTSLYDQVLLRHGMILVQAFHSEGGLNGRPVWVGKHLDGATTTHMLVRLRSADRRLAGYLFAFLRSKAAYMQIAALPYGGAIPHFDESGIGEVVIPIFEEGKCVSMSGEIEAALAQRDHALDNELEARRLLEKAIEQR